ncbi:DNA repair protein RAD4 [Quillaja saponaria]|uniref:DNA repair protein RAD4 n=1 Tax=Quillaja saponaria TaxID=32244 RepID=A0AAD7LWN3_QUISA|nr:DNA repair protein RAD4 [Quillaja saponaria]KAJ7964481.1 DNA repair protein RAD4 [Quillaja saponaria]
MRRRDQSKRKRQSSGAEIAKKSLNDSDSRGHLQSLNDNEPLAEISREAVCKIPSHANKISSSGKSMHGGYINSDSIGIAKCVPERNDKEVLDPTVRWKTSETAGCSQISMRSEEGKCKGAGLGNNKEEIDDLDWEDGSIANLGSTDNMPVTIELNVTPDSARQKRTRRASAADKDLAELVHKVHLLCLLARGRLIDSACDDPLIQASLLSLLPTHLLKISSVEIFSTKDLHPLVSWFHNNFLVRNLTSSKRSFPSLAAALESHEGSPEEIAALLVALFRALKLTTRFVSILDVASLKPDLENSNPSRSAASKPNKGIFNASTLMVSRPKQDSSSPEKSIHFHQREDACETSYGRSRESKECCTRRHIACVAGDLSDRVSDPLPFGEENNISEACISGKSQEPIRKGNLEFQMQLEMALSATAIKTQESEMESCAKGSSSHSLNFSSPFNRLRRIINEESPTSPDGISVAVGSIKVGSPLYWAEVYCGRETLTGKWVHVDAVNFIIDGEQKVEAMAHACKTSLRYVVAFAGQGAKDVTRRYCMKWHKIASQRVDSIWWDAVLAPLRKLEAGATGGMDVLEGHGKNSSVESDSSNTFFHTRSSLEDIELETRALTEPLPTNQQAYKNHQLYAIEKWLTRYQVLRPKGPILGFCSGHPVYPRTCVQTLKTKERWLREGLQVKANEHPVKELKRSVKPYNVQVSEADDGVGNDSEEYIKLFGKWQLEPLCLPHAVNGIVPKNERGQVDVWSEKCLPPGTVHLRLPRVFSVAKRLDIDYAPAMVGFEFRNGRSYPVFDGIVVCTEFKDAILEAFTEEEERREAEEKRRNETQAMSRWYQLLSSIVTRQRLNNRYGQSVVSEKSSDIQPMNSNIQIGGSQDTNQTFGCQIEDTGDTDLNVSSAAPSNIHEHAFLKEYESFDEESSVLTKRCHCGFSVQVEEL